MERAHLRPDHLPHDHRPRAVRLRVLRARASRTASPDAEPSDFASSADFTDETAEANPDWRIDICEEVIGGWRGEGGRSAEMTLVWGVPLIAGARVATAELSGLAVDQCAVAEDRFTLIAPDAYRSDYLDVKLWDADGRELASESLYVEDDDEDEEE